MPALPHLNSGHAPQVRVCGEAGGVGCIIQVEVEAQRYKKKSAEQVAARRRKPFLTLPNGEGGM